MVKGERPTWRIFFHVTVVIQAMSGLNVIESKSKVRMLVNHANGPWTFFGEALKLADAVEVKV